MPSHSTTRRWPAPKGLNSQQSGLGQAKPTKAGSVRPFRPSGGVGLQGRADLAAQKGSERLFDRTDPLPPENPRIFLSTSCRTTLSDSDVMPRSVEMIAGNEDTPQPPWNDGVGRVLSASGGEGAERGGFEPPRPLSEPNGLANRRFRPLSHLSQDATIAPQNGTAWRRFFKPYQTRVASVNRDSGTPDPLSEQPRKSQILLGLKPRSL